MTAADPLKLVGFVFARGGSKSVPRKNLRLAGGKPLIAWAIECALASRHITRVVVSTDDEEIAAVAEAHGAEVPFMRPAELAGDDAPELLAWRHALTEMRRREGDAAPVDPLVSIPTTSPLRAPADVDAAIEEFQRLQAAGRAPDMVLSVAEAHRSPYFNMIVDEPDGFVRVFAQQPGGSPTRRQDVQTVFDITTCVYVTRAGHVLETDALMNGRVGRVLIPQERALDIDTEHDLEVADLLLGRRASG